ncbi:hypothetical protein RFI_07401 [Reticulomyxa filosa]|uniref:Uncharacterized protein n=1 Tax=Reticulomyxa filosa TaxID=46433 RepID=X6NV85_RETFI|nr:hypothetical protein RFI_07401 [Reticulomyxa filosa]|eukprot:ETO29719.1 hypothetical protein RFI_07401 [Reticulomyxa filosa]
MACGFGKLFSLLVFNCFTQVKDDVKFLTAENISIKGKQRRIRSGENMTAKGLDVMIKKTVFVQPRSYLLKLYLIESDKMDDENYINSCPIFQTETATISKTPTFINNKFQIPFSTLVSDNKNLEEIIKQHSLIIEAYMCETIENQIKQRFMGDVVYNLSSKSVQLFNQLSIVEVITFMGIVKYEGIFIFDYILFLLRTQNIKFNCKKKDGAEKEVPIGRTCLQFQCIPINNATEINLFSMHQKIIFIHIHSVQNNNSVLSQYYIRASHIDFEEQRMINSQCNGLVIEKSLFNKKRIKEYNNSIIFFYIKENYSFIQHCSLKINLMKIQMLLKHKIMFRYHLSLHSCDETSQRFVLECSIWFEPKITTLASRNNAIYQVMTVQKKKKLMTFTII